MSEKDDYGVWVGLRKCGCCRAVVVDNPSHSQEVENDKVTFVRDGLQVVYATWAQWRETYLPLMQSECSHEKAEGR